METARMKYDKVTDEECKNRSMTVEKSKAGMKERSSNGLSQPNQNKIWINIIWYYSTRYRRNTMKFN